MAAEQQIDALTNRGRDGILNGSEEKLQRAGGRSPERNPCSLHAETGNPSVPSVKL